MISVPWCNQVNVAARDGWTALHHAAAEGHPEVVSALVAHRADVNAATKDDRTPLYLAAVAGSAACVTALLAARASVHRKSSEGRTPLDVANLFGYGEDVVGPLREALELPEPEILPQEEEEVIPHVREPGKLADFAKWGKLKDEDYEKIDEEADKATNRPSRPRPAETQPKQERTIGPETVPPALAESMASMDPSNPESYKPDNETLYSLRPQPEGGEDPDENNGWKELGYRWGQSPTEVFVWVDAPKGTRAAHVECNMAPDSLSLTLRHPDKTRSTFKNASLWQKIKVEDSLWVLEDGVVSLTLRKVEAKWWRCVVQGGRLIDSTLCRGPELLSEYEGDMEREARQFFGKHLGGTTAW